MFGFFTKENRGMKGEKMVARKLKKLPGSRYLLLNDIMLENSYGTTQIDHIVVSVHGIFVIETKNYIGNIYGNDYYAQWIQEINGRKYDFHNPVKQNYAHVKAVQNLLHIRYKDIIPMIVFADVKEKCWFDVECANPVLHRKQLKKYMTKNYREIIFSPEQMLEFAQEILEADITSGRNKRGHIRAIKHRIKQDRKYLARNRCPRCGAKLHYRRWSHRSVKECHNAGCGFIMHV